MSKKSDTALKKKADKTGMPFGILKQVFNRGKAAWKSGHRPGTNPDQWGFARVNSFATKSKGTWGKADKDLADKVRGSKKKKESMSIEDKVDNLLGEPVNEFIPFSVGDNYASFEAFIREEQIEADDPVVFGWNKSNLPKNVPVRHYPDVPHGDLKDLIGGRRKHTFMGDGYVVFVGPVGVASNVSSRTAMGNDAIVLKDS